MRRHILMLIQKLRQAWLLLGRLAQHAFLVSGAAAGFFRGRIKPLSSARSDRSLLSRFARETHGATAVEFAIVSVPFIMMVLFLVQMGIMFFWTRSVEHASIQAARAIRTGAVQMISPPVSVDGFKNNILCPHLVRGLSCDRVVVSISQIDKVWSPARISGVYDFIDKTKPALLPVRLDQASAPFCLGGPGSFVLLDVVYKAPSMIGPFWPQGSVTKINGEDVLVLRATSVVMNEPYDTTSVPAC